MISIAVEFLLGVAYLDQRGYDQPGRAEWPPHPDRLYMALVAAAHQREPTSDQLIALRWLESAGAPLVSASRAQERPTLETFCPINDELRAQRNKAKQVAATCPDEPQVYYSWDAEPPESVRSGLWTIVQQVTHLGASESLVTCWLDDGPPPASWAPSDSPTTFFRVPYEGRLLELQSAYSARQRPSGVAWSGYRPRIDSLTLPKGEWRSLTALELSGPVDPRDTVALVEATRRCVLEACHDPVPAWVSGHTDDGDRLRGTHLGIVPLANVGHPHANGLIYGVGLLTPARVSPGEANAAFGRLFNDEWWLTSTTSIRAIRQPRKTNSAGLWTTASPRWGTVTPITLHRWPKQQTVEELVLTAIEHAALPPPRAVQLRTTSPHCGGMGLDLRSPPNRYRLHAVIDWGMDVEGPIAIGAGRYKGLGVCKAL